MQVPGCLGYSMCFYFIVFSTLIGHKDCLNAHRL